MNIAICNQETNLSFGRSILQIINENGEKLYGCKYCQTHTIWKCEKIFPEDLNYKQFIKNNEKKFKRIDKDIYEYSYMEIMHVDFLKEANEYLKTKDHYSDLDKELITLLYNNIDKF